ncbi:MAG: YraN family protein [Casimicrobiaceae bacterium]|nr:YraN family protein [Casimicrobiaceae bacterium]MCX8098426.1 YraN family protein [Casimicrobiaceae bacterium]
MARLVSARGWRLLERNWRCRFGEIDLIARDGDTVVFIEVRHRSDDRFGGAAASIDRAKQRRLSRAAQLYLSGYSDIPPCRFDVVVRGAGSGRYEWIEAAFELVAN